VWRLVAVIGNHALTVLGSARLEHSQAELASGLGSTGGVSCGSDHDLFCGEQRDY
jgi:hypothetical protein